MRNAIDIYVKNVRNLLPFRRKQEKVFLAGLRATLEDVCNAEDIHSVSELESYFGSEQEAVNRYLTTVDIHELIRRIKLARFVKIILILIGITLLWASIFHSYYMARLYQSYREEQAVFYRETIGPLD